MSENELLLIASLQRGEGKDAVDEDSSDIADQDENLRLLEPTSFELFRIYRAYIEHQDDLVNQRLYRLFIAHASLAAATGVIIGRSSDTQIGHYVPNVLITLGFLSMGLCTLQYLAIYAAIAAIKELAKKWAKQEKDTRLPGITGGGIPFNASLGRFTSLAAPVVIGFIWFLAVLWGFIMKFHPLMLAR